MRITVQVDRAAFPQNRTGHLAFALWVRQQLGIMVMVNRNLLRRKLVGNLYASGVRFQNEPRGYESFVDALTCVNAGHGDCAHLCCWRVAELNEAGERAALRIKWAHPQYHVQVRRRRMLSADFTRRYGDRDLRTGNPTMDRTIEDPSRILGMP
jgi:hypothetical protein